MYETPVMFQTVKKDTKKYSEKNVIGLKGYVPVVVVVEDDDDDDDDDDVVVKGVRCHDKTYSKTQQPTT